MMTSRLLRLHALARWAVLVVIATGALPAWADAAPPMRDFFSNAAIGEARLSPAGKSVALTVVGKSGRMVLAVVDAALAKPAVLVAADAALDIRSFQWVNENWLVYNLVDLQTGGGIQTFGPGLYAVSIDGSKARELINPVFGRQRALLHVLDNGGTEVMIGEFRFDVVGELTHVNPQRLDVATGNTRAIAPGYPDGSIHWTFDRAGNPRVVVARRNGTSEIFWKENRDGGWRSLAKFPSQQMGWVPFAMDGSDVLYVTRPSERSMDVLTRFDFAAGQPESAALVSTPGFDFYGSMLMSHGKLDGVRVVTDAETTRWFDPRRRELQEQVDKRFPGRSNRMVCGDCLGDGAMLVFSYSDQDPGSYWIRRKTAERWVLLGKVRPAIDPLVMATLDLHRIKARDGEDLPVWVTMPRTKTASPAPAVIFVHRGPWLRGTRWEWNAEVQFLASRGYVVIEPEYRGSVGYGFDHFKNGWKKWGTSMQDDVADAALWAAERGLIDRKRICIAGGRYGGYAALMGAIRHPGLYRCGVAFAAVTDPRLMFENSWASDVSREQREYSLPVLLGDPLKEADLLQAASPAARASEIRIPLLLAFGAKDRRVPLEHGTRLRSSLRASGQEPEWIVYDDEGHGWLKVDNRLDFWKRVEKFLAKHLN